jgi:hypothetical protein
LVLCIENGDWYVYRVEKHSYDVFSAALIDISSINPNIVLSGEKDMAKKAVQHNDSDRPVRIVLLTQLGAVLVMLLAVVFSVPGKRKA